MKKIFKKPKEKILELKNLSSDALLYHQMPNIVMELMHSYFRVKVEGRENIPKEGAAILAPNHSGYTGFDAMILGHEIKKMTGRGARIMTHKFWFLSNLTGYPANKLGFIKATTENGLKHLSNDHMIILFPEGEQGNFKPTHKAYKLQEFKRGFVRMALQIGCPIVPVAIIGAEESHINLKTLKLGKLLGNPILPLPFNVIPLPAKWKIKILKPIYLPFKPEAAGDKELVHEIANDVQERLQAEIYQELKNRGTIFI